MAIKPYIDIVLTGQDNTWSIIAILIIITSLLLRGLILNPLTRRARELPRKDYKRIKAYYLKRSIWGWFFFILFIITSLAVWRAGLSLPFDYAEILLMLCLVVSYSLTIIFHLMAFGAGALHAIREMKET